MALPAVDPTRRADWEIATYVYRIDVDELEPGDEQPRAPLDDAEDPEIAGLATTIERVGVVYPLLVREVEGRVRIVAGERRWRAARLLKRRLGVTAYAVPCIVSAAVPREVEEIALISNVQHLDLLPIETFLAYRRLLEARSLDELALAVGQRPDTIRRFLETMGDDVLGGPVAAGRLSVSNARELVRLGAVARAEMVRLVEQFALNREAIRRAVKALRAQARPGWTHEDVRASVIEALGLDVPRPPSARALAPVTPLRPPTGGTRPVGAVAPGRASAGPVSPQADTRVSGQSTARPLATDPPTSRADGPPDLPPSSNGTDDLERPGATADDPAATPGRGAGIRGIGFPGVGVAPAAPSDSGYRPPEYRSPQQVRTIRTLTLYLKHLRTLLGEREDDLRAYAGELPIRMELQELRDEARRLLGELPTGR